MLSALLAVLFLLLCFLFARNITFDEDINKIIPKNERSGLTSNILSQLNFSDKIVVMIESKNPEDDFALSETADRFLEEIEPLHKYYSKIDGRIDENQISETFTFVHEHLPLFLNDQDYAAIAGKINPDSIAAKTVQNYNELVSPTGIVSREFIKKDPLGITGIGLQKLSALNVGKDFRLENNYVVSSDGKNLLLFIEPAFGGSETKNNEIFVDQLNAVKEKLNKDFNGISEIRYYGSPFIAVANAKQIKKDIQSSVFISSGILLILLIFYFRNFFAPLIIFIPTVFGAAGGLVFIYFLKDSISAISLSVSAILIGITIDYAIHILTHSKHKKSAEEVIREITKPVMMSASTTAISFLCLLFVKSEALQDLGVFASVTVILSAVFTLIIIPQLYNPAKVSANSRTTFVDRLGAYPYEKNRWLVIFCGILIVASFFGWRHVKFNQNINDLNYVPDEMKANEKRLEQLSDLTSKSIYVVSYGNSQDEALKQNAEVHNFLVAQQKQNSIISYNSVGGAVLSKAEQQERINLWNNFWNAERKNNTLATLAQEGSAVGFNETAYEDFTKQLNTQFQPISQEKYGELEALQLDQFINHSNGLYTVSTLVKIDERNRDSFVNAIEKTGNVMAIDRQQLNENFLGLLKEDFTDLINYSVIAVIIVFMLFFRNIDLTLMAVIPILLSGMVTAGILYFLGLEFNIFSTIVCTIIFGAGVDFNIFLTQAMQKEITTGEAQLPLYRVSIILALLTTVLAIGALIFARHPALYSVAAVALIGLCAVTFISFAMYPLMFNFIKKRQEKGRSPITFRLFIHSALSFIYYGLGSAVFSLIGKFLVPKAGTGTLNNIKKLMAGFLKSVLYSNPFVKKRVINFSKENFDKPAIIIANHTSFLDSLVIALVTHKVIFLVNDWVYQSPVFGPMVRALGFYPVSQGIENGMDALKEKVKQGFSLVVFPESQRSYDNRVKRFHKGAFYLAEELKLDIVPMFIHGNSEVLPKNDFIIYDGAITVKVGDRIEYGDTAFGKNYSEKTKKINKMFREEFNGLRQELEDENYFRKTIYLSFLYRENEIVDAVKKDFEDHKTTYFRLNKFIAEDAVILHAAHDYGQKDVLIALQQPGRKIFTYISEEENRNVASQNYLVKRRKIHYLTDINETTKEIDVLLVSDPEFRLSELSRLPRTIMFLQVRPENAVPADYELTHEDAGFIIYSIKE